MKNIKNILLGIWIVVTICLATLTGYYQVALKNERVNNIKLGQALGNCISDNMKNQEECDRALGNAKIIMDGIIQLCTEEIDKLQSELQKCGKSHI